MSMRWRPASSVSNQPDSASHDTLYPGRAPGWVRVSRCLAREFSAARLPWMLTNFYLSLKCTQSLVASSQSERGPRPSITRTSTLTDSVCSASLLIRPVKHHRMRLRVQICRDAFVPVARRLEGRPNAQMAKKADRPRASVVISAPASTSTATQAVHLS